MQRLIWHQTSLPHARCADVHTHGLVFLAYAVESGPKSARIFVSPPDTSSAQHPSQMLDEPKSAVVQIFNGDTCYGDSKRMVHIRNMLSDNMLAMRGARDLVDMRGMQHRFALSDLEKIVGYHIATEDA